jgi:hypothetical protein
MHSARHVLPKSWDSLGPVNNPKHITASEFKPANKVVSSTGISRVFFTVDNEEHATRFIKKLLDKKLVAQVNDQEGNSDRTYL